MQSSRVSKRMAVPAAAIVVFLLSVSQVVGVAQRGTASSPIVGVWRVTERTTTGPNGKKNASPQPGVRIFTAHYYSTNVVTTDAPRPELADNATDKQVADAFGPFTANAGAYEIKGNEILIKTIVAKLPAAMRPGSGETLTFRMEGKDTLWLTQKPGAAALGADRPVENPTTWKLTRLE
jgi:hypothetical protein